MLQAVGSSSSGSSRRNMALYQCVYVMTVMTGILCSAVWADQNQVLSDLLNRMTAMESKVASLGDEVDALDSRLTEVDGGEKPKPVPTEFEVLNMTRSEDLQSSTVTYTLVYQASQPVQILLALSEGKTPTVLTPQQNGTVHFTLPGTVISPLLYVRTSSNLIYTLVLIRPGGPPSGEPEVFPNISVATIPERVIKFQEVQEPEITISSHVTGNRQVRKEALFYYAFVLKDFIVDFVPPLKLYQDNLVPSEAGDGDVDNAGSDNSGYVSQRLRMLDHRRDGGETIDRVKLDTSHENSGVLFIEKRFEFNCQGCILYEIRVTKPMPYFLDDGQYILGHGKGALVAYKDLYFFGEDFEGPRYFRFIRYDQSETAHAFEKTCVEGHPCELVCEAFGDNPTVYFYVSGSILTPNVAFFDQSGNRVDDPNLAKVKGWSLKFGYMGFSVIHFDEVTAEHAGNYNCFAEIDSGLSLRRVYSLKVI